MSEEAVTVCREGLTADIAHQSTRVSEVVAQETKVIQELPPKQSIEEINQVGGRDKPVCYRCGYKGTYVNTKVLSVTYVSKVVIKFVIVHM